MPEEEFQGLKWELIEGAPRDPAAIAALGEEEAERRRYGLEQILDLVRPFIQVDGGDLVLKSVDYIEGIVEVELQGACGSCAVSEMTIDGGIDRIMHQRLDWVKEVRGGVDESVDPLESAAMGKGAYVPKYY
jgi:Fe-S cluster biogenesis protein NfuA